MHMRFFAVYFWPSGGPFHEAARTALAPWPVGNDVHTASNSHEFDLALDVIVH